MGDKPHMQLVELLADYLAIALCGGSPKTERLYRLALARFQETTGEPPTTEHLTDRWIGQHVRRREEVCGVARSTAACEQAKLLALWRFACQQRIVEKWPQIRALKCPVRTPRGWTQDELTRLWDACELAAAVDGIAGFRFWRALLMVFFDTGERASAVFAIRWPWIDAASATIHIPAEYRKGGMVDRSYPVGRDTIEMLMAIRRDSHGPFFTGVTRETLYNRLTKILVAAGLSHDRRSKFHAFRRSAASHFSAAGGNAQTLLGHGSAKTTAGYLDPRICKPAAPCEIIPFRPGCSA